MLDLLDEDNLTYPGDVMTTIANCLLTQAGATTAEPHHGFQIESFQIDVEHCRKYYQPKEEADLYAMVLGVFKRIANIDVAGFASCTMTDGGVIHMGFPPNQSEWKDKVVNDGSGSPNDAQ